MTMFHQRDFEKVIPSLLYIVIDRQTASLDHNSSVGLYTPDSQSWDRKPTDLYVSRRSERTFTRKLA